VFGSHVTYLTGSLGNGKIMRSLYIGLRRISQSARRYMASVLEDAALQERLQLAKHESWTIAADEVG